MASSSHHDTGKLLTELLYCLKYSTLGGSQENLSEEILIYLEQAFGCSTEVMQAALDSVKNAKAPVFQVRLLLGGATGLQNKSVDGPSRPYLTLCLGGQAEASDAGGLQRSAVREGPQPTWNQNFIVDLGNSDSQSLVLNVWNQQSGNSLVRMLTKLSSARRLHR
ncbi:BAI1-associated protein 3-like [Lethenteron reissneri]|uniref:BAI1-associated protein 3-like n=1 Tax=Lethenteron reissneri TaxID=7753 RepID=UPI002AB602D2|nr:BAI1-associated protein 3-like [Lethenteron reissneri]